MSTKLPSGMKLVQTTHADKYWGFYVFLITVALNVGFFRLVEPIRQNRLRRAGQTCSARRNRVADNRSDCRQPAKKNMPLRGGATIGILAVTISAPPQQERAAGMTTRILPLDTQIMRMLAIRWRSQRFFECGILGTMYRVTSKLA
jgi:hypothetical protein